MQKGSNNNKKKDSGRYKEGKYGFNGFRGCDVRLGPCSCGAWHKILKGKRV